jgi:hypothetical protein
LAALWALWHAPLFLVLASYRDFGPSHHPRFRHRSHRRRARPDLDLQRHRRQHPRRRAVGHASYNLAAATNATDGTIAAVATALVIFWAVSII